MPHVCVWVGCEARVNRNRHDVSALFALLALLPHLRLRLGVVGVPVGLVVQPNV